MTYRGLLLWGFTGIVVSMILCTWYLTKSIESVVNKLDTIKNVTQIQSVNSDKEFNEMTKGVLRKQGSIE